MQGFDVKRGQHGESEDDLKDVEPEVAAAYPEINE